MIQLKDILDNKRIAIIGPSPSLLENNNGDLIDSYDIVIRIKKGFPIPDKLKIHLGTKIDILCSHLKFSQNNLEFQDLDKLYQSDCKYIYMPYPNSIQPFDKFYTRFIEHYKQFLNKYKFKKNIEILTSNDQMAYNTLCNDMKTTPTTGISMI